VSCYIVRLRMGLVGLAQFGPFNGGFVFGVWQELSCKGRVPWLSTDVQSSRTRWPTRRH
jgi:hypothetical protein